MKHLIRSVAFAAVVAVPPLAQAAPVTYQFTATITTGSQAGTSPSGTFTYDDSIVPAGGGSISGIGFLTDLSFTFAGVTYDETTADAGSLVFDAGGVLTNFVIGSKCIPFGCLTGAPDWAANVTSFFYENGVRGTISASLVGTTGGTVPEPGSLALGGLALAALGVARSRRRA